MQKIGQIQNGLPTGTNFLNITTGFYNKAHIYPTKCVMQMSKDYRN